MAAATIRLCHHFFLYFFFRVVCHSEINNQKSIGYTHQKKIVSQGGDERRNPWDTTTFVQIEEVKRAIRALPFVTKLVPVRDITVMVMGGGFR